MPKKLITESEIAKLAQSGKRTIEVDADTVFTPSAKDALRDYRIEIIDQKKSAGKQKVHVEGVVYSSPSLKSSKQSQIVIAIGSDHGGFQLKELLKKYLLEKGYTIADVGTRSEEACDYPDFAYAVAALVASGTAQRGIMIDAIGIASAIAANKVAGIRATPCWNEFVAKSSREHNDANILTLGGRILGSEHAKSIVQTWLETAYAGGRHKERVKKISDIEKKFLM